jgi:hypothetical protein
MRQSTSRRPSVDTLDTDTRDIDTQDISARTRRHGSRSGTLGVAALATVAALLIAALLAGCGGSSSNGGVAHLGSDTGTTSTANAGSGEENPAANQKAMVSYARCMRSHGVPGFPEPTEGHIAIRRSAGPGGGSSNAVNPESATFQGADKTCRKLLPNGGVPSPQQQAKAAEGALAFSRCMRSHGVPNFPSPNISGGRISLKLGNGAGLNPSSPQFQAAQRACQSNLGPGGKGKLGAPPPGGPLGGSGG